MKNRFDYILLLLTILVVILTIHILNKPKKQKIEPLKISINKVKTIFPKAKKIKPPSQKEGWIKVLDDKDNFIGHVVLSSPYADDISGYGGPTPLLIAIDPNENITQIIMLENSETPGFVNRIKKSDFLNQWTGTHWKKASSKKVDTISGATLTSSSIIETFQKRLLKINPNINLKPKKKKFKLSIKDIGIVLIPLMGLMLCLGGSKISKKHRYPLMVLSIIILGFSTASCFSLALVSSWITKGLDIYKSWSLLVLIGIAIFTPIITGKNAYCFFICPFGALQEIIFKITPWKIKIKPSLCKKLSYIRYGILLLITISLLVGLKINPNNFEPFSAFMIKSAGPIAITIFIVSLILSIGINRPWCSFGCSSGALIDSLKKTVKDNKKRSDSNED